MKVDIMIDKSLSQRFWSKVKVGLPNDCWEWQASKNGSGYGNMNIGGRIYSAHHISWIIFNGYIPQDLDVLHKCDNPPCINPAHLFLGTHQENMDDMIKKGRHKAVRGNNHISHLHPEIRQGENNGRAKLSSQDVLNIRTRYADGNITQDELAKEYGIVQTAISSIIRYKNWKNLRDES